MKKKKKKKKIKHKQKQAYIHKLKKTKINNKSQQIGQNSRFMKQKSNHEHVHVITLI